MSIMEAMMGAMATSAFAGAVYAVKEVLKIEGLSEDVKYIRDRVDHVYDILARKGSD